MNNATHHNEVSPIINRRIHALHKKIRTHLPIIDISCSISDDTTALRWNVQIGKIMTPRVGPRNKRYIINGMGHTIGDAIQHAERLVQAYLNDLADVEIETIDIELRAIKERTIHLKQKRNLIKASI